MAREIGIYRRGDSRHWWIATTLPNGQRLRLSTGTEDRDEALAFLAKIRVDAFREVNFGIKPHRTWQEAVLRYLAGKQHLRSYKTYRDLCRALDEYLGGLTLNQITGDVVWKIVQDRLKRGNAPATINRLLAVTRNLLRCARDEWQWIDVIPKIRLLPGEVQRDRWLTHEQADRLIAAAKPHLQALIRFALATGCRAREITGLEWERVDLKRATAWLDRTKNGTPRGVPLNADAVAVLEAEVGKHPVYCFTYRGEPIGWEMTNSAWHHAIRKAGITDFRFHDLRHTWASWHRQAGTSCDELKDLGGWKSRVMVDRYAKFATEHLAAAAARVERGRERNVTRLSRFCHVPMRQGRREKRKSLS